MISQLKSRPYIPSLIRKKLKGLNPLVGGEWDLNRKYIKEFKFILKSQLKIIQDDNCAFCGLKLGETSRYEIEHIAPKGGKEKPQHVEYCFTVINLVLACNLCNSSGKKGTFDTISNGPKSLDYTKLNFEIVHPYLDDHSTHYSWVNQDRKVIIQSLTDKGKLSVKLFDLDSAAQSEARAKQLFYQNAPHVIDQGLFDRILNYKL